jgi:hypothetical protein
VVLVGEGRPEERHDPVAHHLVHGALIAMDGLHHELEDRVKDLPRFLGITVGEQLHRAFHIGEQHRHLLTLTLEGSPGGKDAFGEMFGCVDVGRLEPRGGDLAKWGGTLTAEPVLRRIAGAAGRAHGCQGGGALAAELHAGGVLGLAPRTLHVHTSNAGWPEGGLGLGESARSAALRGA